MKRIVVLCSLALVSLSSNAQSIFVSPSSLQFDTVLVSTRDSLSFHICNNSSDTLRVSDINTNKAAFSVHDTAFTVFPNDSTRIWLFFQTNQNVSWNDVVLIENSGARGTLLLPVKGTGKYPGSSYATTQGLWENDLKTALLNLVNNHAVLGYNTARDRMYETIDDPLNNDTLECVYTGRKIYARTRTEAQNQNFNTEHTWPQSFFNSSDPMVSDLNHLFPTDVVANSQRANYPFGPVVSNVTWQVGGSKLGRNPNGQTVFEPRDTHKGDVARVLFYFLLRYPSNYGGFMDATQEFYLRQWYRSDPVSQKETLRSNGVAIFQGKRNPLVDHQEFIDRISYFRSSVAPVLQPDILASPLIVQFGHIAVGDSSEWRISIVNRGRGVLSISSVTLQNASSAFSIVNVPVTVSADSFVQVRLKFKPDQPNQVYSNAIVVQSNDPDQASVSIAATASSSGTSSVALSTQPGEFYLHQNFPNPFNPTTTLSFALGHPSFASLKVYDLLGREVATLIDQQLSAGGYNIVWNAADASSGVYFARLQAGGKLFSRRLVLMR